MGFLDSVGLGGRLDGFTSSLAGLGTGMMWMFIVFLALCVGGVIFYFIWDWLSYKKKIVLFENLGGRQYVMSGTDRAKVIRVGDGGEEILKLKKRKCFRTAYGRKMAKNTYWFAVGQDGYWYNIVLGDLDAKKGELDIEPIDRDMRYMHVAIRKNIQQRYHKEKFMDKYGVWLMSGIFLLIMIGGLWFLIDKMAEISSSNAGVLDATGKLVSKSADLITAIERMQTGGSGLVPAG